MNRAPFDLTDKLIAYGTDNRAHRIAALPAEADPTHSQYLVGVISFKNDASVHADVWERHPAGDEILCVLDGRLLITLEDDEGTATRFTLEQGYACIVPQDAWHRLQVIEPGRLAFFTPGAGTSMRPQSERGVR